MKKGCRESPDRIGAIPKTRVPVGHAGSRSPHTDPTMSGQDRPTHETRYAPEALAGIVFPPGRYVNQPGAPGASTEIRIPASQRTPKGYPPQVSTALPGDYSTTERIEGIVFPPKIALDRARVGEYARRHETRGSRASARASRDAATAARQNSGSNPVAIGDPAKCWKPGCTFTGLPEHRGFCSKHLKEFIQQDASQGGGPITMDWEREELYEGISGQSPPRNISYGQGVPGQGYDEHAELIPREERHTVAPYPAAGGDPLPEHRCQFTLGDVSMEPSSEEGMPHVGPSGTALHGRELYDEVTAAQGHLRHNDSNISYGEGVAGQRYDENPLKTPEVVQGMQRQDVRRQPESYSRPIPHSASYPSIASSPIQTDKQYPKSSSGSTPGRSFHWRRAGRTPTSAYADPPLRIPCKVQHCSNKGEPGLHYHCTRCSNYNGIIMPPTPRFEMDQRFPTPEKGTLNIPERPGSLDISASTPRQQPRSQSLSKRDREDYETMVSNIQAVSKNAMRKCRTEGCENFGNKGAHWFCNECYSHRCSPRTHSGTCSMPCAKCIWNTVPIDLTEDTSQDLSRRPSGHALAIPSPLRPKPRSDRTDPDIQSLLKIRRYYCKTPKCPNYGSGNNAGYCGACYQLNAV